MNQDEEDINTAKVISIEICFILFIACLCFGSILPWVKYWFLKILIWVSGIITCIFNGRLLVPRIYRCIKKIRRINQKTNEPRVQTIQDEENINKAKEISKTISVIISQACFFGSVLLLFLFKPEGDIEKSIYLFLTLLSWVSGLIIYIHRDFFITPFVIKIRENHLDKNRSL